ncbi:LysR family transcriptional regulator [Ruminococcus sp. NK3A76]|uniref:LysR family transcriptional regulator n=1 Tax=Ruminococcus sp. NK3A76 TaxID=877411 RepID=UPI00048BDA95|nr:LysR family transcriptional regulator [Ruminococcus sp. NK3A76]
MTLQQLRYIIEIAETGSITMAAQRLFIAQPSLSKSVAELEKEMGITIFARSNRGVYLTEEGSRFLSYARQIIEQTQLLESEYKSAPPPNRVFAVSSQHYAFVVNAFVELVREYGKDKYEFTLRELKTAEIIEDVRTHRSDIGVLFLSSFNREVIRHILQSEELKFETLFTAKPHVFVSKNNPLVGRSSVTLEDLREFPRLTYDQGVKNSFYFAEELHITEQSPKNIIVSDRASLFNLLIGLDGYTISSGVLSSDLNGDNIVSIPLESDERMEIGYIITNDRPMNAMTQSYLEHLNRYISNYSPDQ